MGVVVDGWDIDPAKTTEKLAHAEAQHERAMRDLARAETRWDAQPWNDRRWLEVRECKADVHYWRRWAAHLRDMLERAQAILQRPRD
jgi:hypothetical protein